MKPALAQVCSLPSPFAQDIEDYAAGKCDAIEVWFTKLEDFVQAHSIQKVISLMERFGVSLPVASYQGGLLTAASDPRREAWKQFQRRLDLCKQLGVKTVVVAADVPEPLTHDGVRQLERSLAELADVALSENLKIALEFHASSSFCNNLQTAAALVESVNRPSLGICLDAFHFFIGPSKTEDLSFLQANNLFHVQLSDLDNVPREFAADSMRILPGEGDFQLATIVDHLINISYDAYVSIELMNPRIWQVPARQFGEIGMTSIRAMLGMTQPE